MKKSYVSVKVKVKALSGRGLRSLASMVKERIFVVGYNFSL